MGGVFKAVKRILSPKVEKPAPPPPPPAAPEPQDTQGALDEEKRKNRARRGRQSQVASKGLLGSNAKTTGLLND